MRARIPADIDMADRIFAGLTARQLAIIGGHVLVLWMIWLAAGRVLTPYGFVVIAIPIAVLGLVWSTSKVEGTTLERLGVAALRHFRVPRRRVAAPEGIPATPRWASRRVPAVAPLELPVQGGMEAGVDLGSEGTATVCRASAINFSLRSEAEQRALVEGFGRLLNALNEPAQFLMHSDRAELDSMIGSIENEAKALPHPALEQAALEHAAFLRSLAARGDVLARQVLICFREQRSPADANGRLMRRCDETAALLRGMGIRLSRFEGTEATALLARACDPESDHSGAFSLDEVVEGAK